MYSSKGILFSELHKQIATQISEDENTIVQIYGSDAGEILSACRILFEAVPFLRGVDVNLGCPAECARREGYGYYFSQDAAELLLRLKQQHPARQISAKLRLRFSLEENAQLLAKMDATGIDRLFVHCRRSQLANSASQLETPDHQALKDALKQAGALKMQVVANGGIQTK